MATKPFDYDMYLTPAIYSNCQKYVPIDLANYSKVIASGAKQCLRLSKILVRRPPEADSSQ